MIFVDRCVQTWNRQCESRGGGLPATADRARVSTDGLVCALRDSNGGLLAAFRRDPDTGTLVRIDRDRPRPELP